MDVAHCEVDRQNDGDTHRGDDHHEHQQVSLEPDVLDGVYAAPPQDHVIRQGEHAHDPGAHPAVHLGEVPGHDRLAVPGLAPALEGGLLVVVRVSAVLGLVLGVEDLRPAGLVVILPDERESAVVTRGSPQDGEEEKQDNEPDLIRVATISKEVELTLSNS